MTYMYINMNIDNVLSRVFEFRASQEQIDRCTLTHKHTCILILIMIKFFRVSSRILCADRSDAQG